MPKIPKNLTKTPRSCGRNGGINLSNFALFCYKKSNSIKQCKIMSNHIKKCKNLSKKSNDKALVVNPKRRRWTLVVFLKKP